MGTSSSSFLLILAQDVNLFYYVALSLGISLLCKSSYFFWCMKPCVWFTHRIPNMPLILVCDVGVLTPADLFEGQKPILSNIPFNLPQWTIPFHISSSFTELYWMILDLWPNTKCKVVHWNPKNTVLIIVFILTFGGGFHINAIHVNHPEWF